jgi:hypothetical protein
MKYLRKFNESIERNLEEFVRDNLAHLVDSGYNILVEENLRYYEIFITKRELINGSMRKVIFEWSDVEDEIIPFIELLSTSIYELESIFFRRHANHISIEHTAEDILDDEVSKDLENLNGIYFYIKINR